MYLKSLELQGFKSFPDKTILDFGRGITGVVGPNGSGKSNISDAIRWVLGEQSSKSLRGAKMEDVIFSGTRFRTSLSFAKVSLTLDNTDRTLAVDDNDVVITRRYYRSGESEYLINQQNVRLKDVHELLMDTGLGRDGYAIVGQGKIAEIISAKSDDRRQIFEEAAGISKYRYRKEDAQKRLDLSEENLVRLRDILSELESRVGPLRVQSEKAHKFIELSDRKKQVEVVLWNNELKRIKSLTGELEKKIFIAENQIEEINVSIGDRENTLEKLYLGRQNSAVKIDELNREKNEINDDISKLRSTVAVIENDIRHARELIEQMGDETSKTEKDLAQIKVTIENKNQQLKTAADELESLKTEADSAQEELLSKKNDGVGYSDRIDELTALIGEMGKSASDYKVQSYSGRSTITEIETHIASCDEKILSMTDEYERQKNEVKKIETDMEDVCEVIVSTNNSMDGLKMMAELKQSKAEGCFEKIKSLQQEIEATAQRVKILRDLENSMEGFSYSVKTLISEGKSGNIRGIHGVVSQLIHVKEIHAIAIETALGAALQNIVVESEDTAKSCIAYLKGKKSGRATFLPLTSVKSRGGISEPVANMEGFVSIGAELVSCDDKYRQIISSLLGKTVVVETINDAVKMAKKFSYRFRIVTLDGQVMNPGGSMTGGSLVKSSGILGRGEQITNLEQSIEQKKISLAEMNNEYRQKKNDADSISAQLEGMLAEEKTAKENKTRLTYLLESSRRTLAESERQYSDTIEDKRSSQLRLDEVLLQVKQWEKEHEAVQSRVEILSCELQSITGLSRQITDEINLRAEDLSAKKIEAFSKEKEIENIKNEIKTLEYQMKTADEQSDTVSERVKNAVADIESLKADSENLNISEKEKKDRITQIDNEILECNKVRDEKERDSISIRDSIKDVMEDRERLSGERARLEERKTASDTEYDTIVKNLWDEYEMTRGEATKLAENIGDIPQSKQEIASLKNAIRTLGNVNVGAIEEYKEVVDRYTFMKEQAEDVENAKNQLLGLVNELTGEMKKAFMDSFTAIDKHFRRVFADLFGGGTARLSLADENDILECGIDIFVEPPGKIIKNLASLSGGEQAFVAISIYFAILAVKPAPFCVLDEIEAALDDVNVYKYAKYLRKMNDKTQFVTITHRRGTMEESDTLFGVTMQDDGVSKMLTLNVDEVEEKLGVK